MNGGRLKGEVGKLLHFIYLFIFFKLFHICSGGPTRSFHFCLTEKNRRRVQDMFGCFLFLSCLLSLPAPPSSCHECPDKHTHIQTHIHTQSKNYWLCILHESSTSEGLFAFFILQLRAEMMRWKPDPALKGCFLTLLQKPEAAV